MYSRDVIIKHALQDHKIGIPKYLPYEGDDLKLYMQALQTYEIQSLGRVVRQVEKHNSKLPEINY